MNINELNLCISAEELAQTINTNCSLIKNSGRTLYRGARYKCQQGIGKIRTDRKPRDSTSYDVMVFDMLMEYKKWPFRKSNTLSVSTNTRQPERYGKTHSVYPFDGSVYLYSIHAVYRDMITFPQRFREFVTGLASDIVSRENLDKEFYANIEQNIKDNAANFFEEYPLYTSKNPKKIESSGEVLVYGTYYAYKLL